MNLAGPVANLKGVGPRLGERLARLGVDSIADLLCLLPQRYEDRTEVRPLGGLRPGEKVLIEAKVELAEVVFRGRRSLLCRVTDGTGAITLRFFHFSRGQQEDAEPGSAAPMLRRSARRADGARDDPSRVPHP